MEDLGKVFRVGVAMSTIVVVVALQSCQCSDSTRGGHHDTDTTSDAGTDAGDEPDADTGSETEIDTNFPSDAIPTTCEEAEEKPTSVGCEFFAADLDNYTNEGEVENPDSEPYSIVVSNPQEEQVASITLQDGTDGEIFSTVLDPGQLEVIDVACDSGCLVPPHQVEMQGIAMAAGFRLTSDVPVLAYQWNPYGVDGATSDASLLIPTSSLGDAYIVAAWGYGGGADYPVLVSQVTVVATQDATTVTFVPSVDVPALGGVGPFPAGVETELVTLDAFDVIVVSAPVDQDITGTVVSADKPIAVFGGHSCAMVPNHDFWACDHLEDQMIPLSAWGTSTVLARYAPRHNCESEDLALWRIIAGADNMKVTFDPPAPAPASSEHGFSTAGEVLEFMAPGDYFAEGLFDAPEDPEHPEAPFLAYQLMTGGEFANCYFTSYSREGDPFMLLSPPAGQYLDRYVFNTPDSYDFAYDHIIIVRPEGAHVAVDCLGLISDSEFVPVGTSGWEVARIFVDDLDVPTGCEDGAHLLTASESVGLSVVGTDFADSYGYLGGIGVKPINPVIE